MAASDPSPYVATPTGTLQGVAAFSWDGSAWQPTGRAGPDVATPTGVLQGVAAFNGGPAWQPAGRAQPGVATPTGVLDGVAVYTWSGSAWTPVGGTATPSTPSGALRGVAAFSWDGAAWQPAAQARPSVPTPYGVLDGVAFFNWGGSAWQAGAAVPPGATLDLSFLTGTLDPRITFTRASTATYFDATGTMRTAAMNLWISSGDASQWGSLAAVVAAPVVTANQTIAPDGTMTAARVVLPACSAAGSRSMLYQGITVAATVYTLSVFMRGAVGGEQTYISHTNGSGTAASLRVTLTTSWQRFSLTTAPLIAGGWFFQFGTDMINDPSQTNTPAETVFIWGAQVESGATATTYIPTTNTGANGAPRFDYDPVTHAQRGLLVEDTRTNLLPNSGNAAAATWAPSGITVAAPTITGNLVVALDGTTTAARMVMPAVPAAGNGSYVLVNSAALSLTAAAYSFSVWLRGNTGGEQLYLSTTTDAVTYFRQSVTLTTNWQRFTLVTGNLSTAGWLFLLGTDRRDASQTATLAQTIFVWGAQIELGAFPTSYIATAAAAVTRAIDLCSMPTAGWFTPAGYSVTFEFDEPAVASVVGGISDAAFGSNTSYFSSSQFTASGQAAGGSSAIVAGAVTKQCGTGTAALIRVCNNGGTVGSVASVGTQSGATRIAFGNDPWGMASAFNGHMRRVRCWPRALSDGEMQGVTS